MGKNLYFVSLGCTKNQVDSEIMLFKLFQNGLKLSNEITKADFFVINTCGFLKEARDEAFFILDEIFKNKKKSAKVIVAGCMANLFKDEIKQRHEIFSIISSGNLDKILEVINKSSYLVDNLSYLTNAHNPRVLTDLKHLSYLKISEGCQKACAFCIIPKIKGKLISRTDKSILNEFKNLLDQGVFEINFIAQDLLDYAKDRNEKGAFIKLIKKILEIKKDFLLRFLYVYPDEITDEFIDLIASDNRICKYLDIPLQHVSDNILKSMKRKTSSKKIFSLFEKLRNKIPNLSIRTSLMVGFPNEKDKDFKKLLEFIEKFQIDHLAAFKYSNEKLAFSYDFKNQVDEKTKEKRFELLTKKQLNLVQRRNKKLIGKILDAIMDDYHPETNLLMLARHFGQAYKIDSNIIINDIEKIKAFGKIYKIKITDISGYDLIGFPLK